MPASAHRRVPTRLVVGAVAAALLVAVAPLVARSQTGVPERQEEDGRLPTVRYAGANRFDTAAQIATDRSPDAPAPEPGTVVVARGDLFPDALAGNYLAGQFRAPVLLTAPDALPDETINAMFDLAPDRVVVIGGESAVSASVVEELERFGAEVERVAGANRFDTAAQIARYGPVPRPGLEFVEEQGAAGAAEGLYNVPTDVGTAPDGSFFVADQFNHRVQVFTADGAFVRAFGTAGSGPGQLNTPVGVAVSDDRVYVSEFDGDRVQVFGLDGSALDVFGEAGEGDAQFNNPTNVSLGPDGLLYVGDDDNFRIQVFTRDGEFLRSFGSEGSGPGQIAGPRGMDHDAAGNLLVAERDNNRIQVFSPDGRPVGQFTEGSDGQPLDQPYDVTVGADGRLYVADRGNSRIQILEADGTPVAATNVAGGAAPDFDPIASGLAPDGTLLVSDAANHRVLRYALAGEGFGLLNGLKTAILATGERASDALVAGAASYEAGFPLLLTGAASLPQETAQTLSDLAIQQVIVIGGTAAVSDEVVAAVQERDVVVQRIAGPDRVSTALSFARFTYDQLDFLQDSLNLASGTPEAFPDTLSLGPQAGLERAPILLTGGGATLDASLQEFLTETGPCTVRFLSVAGGRAALPDSVVDAAREATPYDVTCPPGPEPSPSPTASPSPSPSEPEEGTGGLTVTVPSSQGLVGAEIDVTVTLDGSGGSGTDSVLVEVYSEANDNTGGVSRYLLSSSTVDVSSGTAVLSYTSPSPRADRIVACIAPDDGSCSAGGREPYNPGAVRFREDLEAFASTAVQWRADFTAPLQGAPEGGADDDAGGVAFLQVTSDDRLCYGLFDVSGLPLPAAHASLRAPDGSLLATLAPPVEVGERPAPTAGGPIGESSGCANDADPTAVRTFSSSSTGGYTVRIDTDEHPDGALLGEVLRSSAIPPPSQQAMLSGTALGEGGAPSGSGFVTIGVIVQTDPVICATTFVRGLEAQVTAVRIHRGPPDGSGPVIMDLPVPNAEGVTYGCVRSEALSGDATDEDLSALGDARGEYSVVVESSAGGLSGYLAWRG